jgi:hypothetical protein
MKKILVALALALHATASFATVVNSPHDFNAGGTFNSSGTNYAPVGGKASRCVYCHVPHGAQAWAGVALWATGSPNATLFQYYSSANVVVTSIDVAKSQTCLACHADGTTAITGLAVPVDTSAMIGYNLKLSHPVGDQATMTSGAGGMQANIYIGRTSLPNGTTLTGGVQCATCHSVHGYSNYTIQGRKLLYGGSSTTGSMAGGWPQSTDFCTICHNR